MDTRGWGLKLPGAALCLIFAQPGLTAGFALNEQSATGTGAALAGSAVGYGDASASWFNPAAMTRLSGRHISLGASLIRVEGDFDDRGSSTNPLLGDNDIEGSTGGFSTSEFVPVFYYVAEWRRDLRYGLAIVPSYGLATHYEDDWTGRYSAIDSELSGISIVPSLAYRLNDSLSLGAGLHVQYLDARQSNAIDTGAVCIGNAADNAERADCLRNGYLPANPDTDSNVEVSGDSWALGLNVGLLYEASPDTRFGAAYQSAIDHTLEGDAGFSQSAEMQALLGANDAALFTDTGAKADAVMPASLTLSALHKLGPKLSVLGEVKQTWWSSFDTLTVDFDNAQQEDSTSVYAWDDARRYSIGLAYQAEEQWIWRGGLALDESPIRAAQNRTPRIPDTDRTWLSFGATYFASERLRLDAALALVFSDEAAVDHTEENSGHTVRGVFDVSSTVVAAQLSWQLD